VKHALHSRSDSSSQLDEKRVPTSAFSTSARWPPARRGAPMSAKCRAPPAPALRAPSMPAPAATRWARCIHRAISQASRHVDVACTSGKPCFWITSDGNANADFEAGAHTQQRRQVENGKPAPDCFTATARRLGIEPDECLVIEDAPTGVQVRALWSASSHNLLFCGNLCGDVAV